MCLFCFSSDFFVQLFPYILEEMGNGKAFLIAFIFLVTCKIFVKTFCIVFVFVHCMFSSKDPNNPSADKCCQVLMDLVDMNLYVLNGKDPSALDKSIREILNGKLFLWARIHKQIIFGLSY